MSLEKLAKNQEQLDEMRNILAEVPVGTDLNSLVLYTQEHGFEVIKGFLDFNGGMWDAEEFDDQYIGEFEGWVEFFLEHVLEGYSTINGIDIWDVLDGKRIEDQLTGGELNEFTYMGVATGFCQGVFFRKYTG